MSEDSASGELENLPDHTGKGNPGGLGENSRTGREKRRSPSDMLTKTPKPTIGDRMPFYKAEKPAFHVALFGPEKTVIARFRAKIEMIFFNI